MPSQLIAEFRKPKSDLFLAGFFFLVFLKYIWGFYTTGGYEPWISNWIGRFYTIDIVLFLVSIIMPIPLVLAYFKSSLQIYDDKIINQNPLSWYYEIEISKENYEGYYLKKYNERLTLHITQKNSKYKIKFDTKCQIPQVIAILEHYYKPTI